MKQITKIKIVNAITLLRVIGTIILPTIAISCDSLVTAIYIGIILMTDLIDGRLARKWDVSTIFGSVLDAFSDKLFGISVLLYLSIINPIMLFLILFEILIAVNNTISIMNNNDIKTSKIGKIKTLTLGVTNFLVIILNVIKEQLVKPLLFILFPLNLILQIITLIGYKNISNNKNKMKFKVIIKKLRKNKELKTRLFSPEYFKENYDKPLLENLISEE